VLGFCLVGEAGTEPAFHLGEGQVFAGSIVGYLNAAV
jgi:hypothetical protein